MVAVPSPEHDVARAYATLGLRRDCSPRDATRAYKALVRRWHPDRHGSDPEGQAEATIRLREINRAFDVVRRTLVDTSATSRARGETPFGSRLPPDEVDAIVSSMHGRSLATMLASYLLWGLSSAFALLLIAQPGSSPRNAVNTTAGVVWLLFAGGRWLHRYRASRD